MTARELELLRGSLGWRLVGHARAARCRRGFTVQEVLLAVMDPEVSHTSENYGPGRVVYKRGRLAVVGVPTTRTIVTVLLRSYDEWTDSDALAA